MAHPPDEAAEHSTLDGPVDLAGRLGRIDSELGALRAELSHQDDRAAARERIIDRLHSENELLRTGERRLLLGPILVDLQRLRHDLLREAGRLPASISASQMADMLRTYAMNVELTLERGGVQVLRPLPGVAFDPAQHRAAGIVAAATPDQDATVAEVVLDGYVDSIAGRTVLPAAVRVSQWQTPSPAAPAPRSADQSAKADQSAHADQSAPTT